MDRFWHLAREDQSTGEESVSDVAIDPTARLAKPFFEKLYLVALARFLAYDHAATFGIHARPYEWAA